MGLSELDDCFIQRSEAVWSAAQPESETARMGLGRRELHG